MSVVGALLGFGLRQLIGEGIENVAEAVQQKFRDHSQTLPRALERAHERAWQGLGVALAGNGLLDRVRVFFSTSDDKGIREQVTAFLQGSGVSFEGSPAAFRQACLEDLKRLRRSGRLSCQGLVAGEIARQAAGFRRYVDPQPLIEGATQAVAQVADDLREGYPDLARLLRTPTPAGPPLLAAAFAYFLRREIETDDELANGLFFDSLRQLSASQSKAFGEVSKALTTIGDRFDEALEQLGRIEAEVVQTRSTVTATHGVVLDLQAEMQRVKDLQLANAEEVRSLFVQVQQQLSRAGMQGGELRPQNSLSINGEDERRAVRSLLERLRQLPAEERQKVPGLLNGLGKLQAGAGDFGGAKQTFDEAARSAGEDAARAEMRFNAYRAALEARKWDEALDALREAASLAPQRFAPFPLHRYQPRRLLGAGGFGTAFLCHDANFGEDVVVKTLHTADLERGLNDVFREARVLRQLSHPAIIGARDCEYADAVGKERPYLVMDYFPGSTLEQFVEENGPLTPQQLPLVAVPVAQGMQAAHRQGVLHRDLKPSNVLVRNEGGEWRVKIIDFGLALRQQAIETSIAARQAETTILGGSVAGTLKYAPPEQMGELKGVKPGPYSDVYAFGKLCCYALFRTTEPTRRQWSAIPEALADVLDRCVERELEHRHSGFEPVLGVLEALASGKGVPGPKVRKKPEKKLQSPPESAAPLPGVEQRGAAPDEDIEAYYRDFRDRHGTRPRAIQAFRDGHDPRSVRARHGSWLWFVEAMGDLSEGQKLLLRDLGDLLATIESTPMTRSFKMLTLQALLNRKALPGSLGIRDLAAEFGRLAASSSILRAEVGAELDDLDRLCRYLERNPVAAWAGGKGTGGKAYFAYNQAVFSSTFAVAEDLRPEFHELAREVIEWRLAAYLKREENR
jgi:tetratricopeptide (TPR) repeat protein